MGKHKYLEMVEVNQQGGQMTTPEQVAPQENPIEKVMQMAQQALDSNDGQMALEVCRQLMSLAQSQKKGGEMKKKVVKPMKYSK